MQTQGQMSYLAKLTEFCDSAPWFRATPKSNGFFLGRRHTLPPSFMQIGLVGIIQFTRKLKPTETLGTNHLRDSNSNSALDIEYFSPSRTWNVVVSLHNTYLFFIKIRSVYVFVNEYCLCCSMHYLSVSMQHKWDRCLCYSSGGWELNVQNL